MRRAYATRTDRIFPRSRRRPGLLLAQAPTGYGKTYQAVQAIYAYLRQGGTSRVLFVTTLLKNLPVEDLRHAYEEDGRGDEFDREVLVLRSAADTVVEALERQEVPEEFQTEAFRALKNACGNTGHTRPSPETPRRSWQERCTIPSERSWSPRSATSWKPACAKPSPEGPPSGGTRYASKSVTAGSGNSIPRCSGRTIRCCFSR